jgi:hypothetical protein
MCPPECGWYRKDGIGTVRMWVMHGRVWVLKKGSRWDKEGLGNAGRLWMLQKGYR